MRGRPIAAFDLDDTLNLLKDSFYKQLSKHRAIPPIHEWKRDLACCSSGLRGEELQAFLRNNRSLEVAPVEPTAFDAVNALVDTHEIWIVTARAFHPNAELITRRWLRAHSIHYDRLVIVEHGIPKGLLLEEVRDRVAFFADDIASHVESVGTVSPHSFPVLIKRPWNQTASTTKASNVMEAVRLYKAHVANASRGRTGTNG